MKINEIAFVCYPVTDLKRARGFYEDVLGLKITHSFGNIEETAWIEYDIGPGTLAIGNGAPEWKPGGGPTAGLEVDDFDAAIAELKAAGVQFMVEPTDTPVCRMAIVADPDGNAVTIHKRKAG